MKISQRPLSETERGVMRDWVSSRNRFLDENSKLKRIEEECPITKENIYDRCELLTSKDKKTSFERHALLEWLLINPKNPISNSTISDEQIRQIYYGIPVA